MSPRDFLRKLRGYPPAEWPWMVEAGLSLAWARFLIRFIPYPRWRHRMGPLGSNGSDTPELSPAQQAKMRLVRRWVRRVSANAPFQAICLPQAMAARWMLARRGIASELHFGARPSSGDTAPVDLHAWLLCGGRYVTGEKERPTFTAFESGADGISS